MLDGHVLGMTDATAGCTQSKTGLCKDCPKFMQMTTNVEDPRTGKILKSYTTWDCADVWAMLGSWDSGRQSLRVHAAISEQTNETVKRQDEFLQLASGGRPRAIRQD